MESSALVNLVHWVYDNMNVVIDKCNTHESPFREPTQESREWILMDPS